MVGIKASSMLHVCIQLLTKDNNNGGTSNNKCECTVCVQDHTVSSSGLYGMMDTFYAKYMMPSVKLAGSISLHAGIHKFDVVYCLICTTHARADQGTKHICARKYGSRQGDSLGQPM